MPDTNLIYSIEDACSLLSYAIGSGLLVAIDTPSDKPTINFLTKVDNKTIPDGVYLIYHPDWIFGELHYKEISEDYNGNRGKHHVSLGINWISIQCALDSKDKNRNLARLGCGNIWFRPTWLKMPQNITSPVPGDVAVWYEKIIGHVDSGKTVKGGLTTYRLCKGAIEALKTSPLPIYI